MDAERAHKIGMTVIGSGIVRCLPPDNARWRTTAFGKTFAHPVGLAAGFDKDGDAIDEWEGLGFSFLEVGTVTPLPQLGNPKPRLFRLQEDGALINRMGFNNAGIHELANRLEARQTLIPVGANIGKNSTTPNEQAARDYETAAKLLGPLVDYLVINVSSPNTLGLRELQQSDAIKSILDATRSAEPNKPVLVKLSPDLHDDDLKAVIETCLENGCAGFVVTNTSLSRDGLISANKLQSGGLSGSPLKDRANDVSRLVRGAAGLEPTIIGVGGISSGADLLERLRAGANLCQIYTSFIYRGPCAVKQILEEFDTALQFAGIESIAELTPC